MAKKQISIYIITIILINISLLVKLNYAEEKTYLVKLKGISIDMKKKSLLENWGYPFKRERIGKNEIWYYHNENTPHPTDGIMVKFRNDKVKEWKVVDNIYRYMKIWGKDAGEY